MQSSELGICKMGTVPFVKRRYVKEGPFFQIPYKRVRGCTSWRSLSVYNFVEYPSPGIWPWTKNHHPSVPKVIYRYQPELGALMVFAEFAPPTLINAF